MSGRLILAIAGAAVAFAGCETTGDPRAGGFFGWSETKAQGRLADRQHMLRRAKGNLADESGRTRSLRARESVVQSEVAHADAQQRAQLEQLQRQCTRTLQRARRLEDDAITSATASRARRWRAEVEAIGGDTTRVPEERTARLRCLDREISAAQTRAAH